MLHLHLRTAQQQKNCKCHSRKQDCEAIPLPLHDVNCEHFMHSHLLAVLREAAQVLPPSPGAQAALHHHYSTDVGMHQESQPARVLCPNVV